MLTFLTYYSVGIHPRLDSRIGRGVPNAQIPSFEQNVICCQQVLTHYQMINFRLFRIEDFADDNFKFEEKGRKLSKPVENTVGKGEIARYEQFLLFPQSFQKACFPGLSKGVTVWEWVKDFPYYTSSLRIFLNVAVHLSLYKILVTLFSKLL